MYLAPACLVLFFFPRVFGFPGWAVAIACLLLSVIQALYEYSKWQQDVRDGIYNIPPVQQ